MEAKVDHYMVLGLPGGEEGGKLTQKEIGKAYRAKALELHPDKRPDDPNAHSDFQKLRQSYEVLKDEKSRKAFDDLLKQQRQQEVLGQEQVMRQNNGRKRKMESNDLAAAFEEWERAVVDAQQEVEWLARQLREEAARIRVMHANKRNRKPGTADSFSDRLNREVPWKNIRGEDYGTALPLKELLSKIVK